MKILLIHGLSRTSLSLFNLAWRLEAYGWQTEHFGYAAVVESFDSIVNRLQDRLHTLAGQEPYAIVAHSLGGLLTRAALGHAALPQPHHVVMLGTPNQLPRLAPLAWHVHPFRWWTGSCGFNLTQTSFFEQLPKLRSPYTIIAGVGGPRGVLSPFGQDANDGIVALTETPLEASDRPIQLPVMHTFMMHDPTVQSIVVRALEPLLPAALPPADPGLSA
jgi:pimeloyl-ACP methyl ester carboxylesterase